jgi:hypothetical protein
MTKKIAFAGKPVPEVQTGYIPFRNLDRRQSDSALYEEINFQP